MGHPLFSIIRLKTQKLSNADNIDIQAIYANTLINCKLRGSFL